MNLSIQKIDGYQVGYYLLSGGPEPKLVTKQMVSESVRRLSNQIDIQKQLLAKIEELEIPIVTPEVISPLAAQ